MECSGSLAGAATEHEHVAVSAAYCGVARFLRARAVLCSIRRACAGEPGAVQSQVSRWACDYYFQARLT